MQPSARKSAILLLMLWGCVSGQQNYLGAPQASSAWQQQQQQQQPQLQSPPLYQPFQSAQQQQPGGLSGYPAQQQPQQQQPGGLSGYPAQQQPQQQQPGGLSSYPAPQPQQQHAVSSSGYMQQPLYGSRSHGGQGLQAAQGLLGAHSPSHQAYPPNDTRDTGLTIPTTPAPPGFPHGAGGAAADNQNALQLEPHGSVNQPDPNRPDSQVFKAGDQALYAVDWSYPRSRHAPASIVLKRWGAQSPPEYVAVYRLRGPAPPAPPSYSMAHDELRHYPWDAARRFQAPRWRTAPRDEDFELVPAGTGLHGGGLPAPAPASHQLPSQQQQYMFRTL